MIGFPPFDDGADQVTVAWPAAGDVAPGVPGAPGGPAMTVADLVDDQPDVASSFFARTRNSYVAPGTRPVRYRNGAVSDVDDHDDVPDTR